MSDEAKEQQAVEEVQRRIAYLLLTDQISRSQKIFTTRNVLGLIEYGKKEEVIQ